MSSLYQSQLRKDLQGAVYRNPTITVKLFGKDYFGTIKTKKIGPFTTRRYQIMGVTLPDDEQEIREGIKELRKRFRGKGMFFQLGLRNPIVSFENSEMKSEEFKEDMKVTRTHLERFLCKRYGLRPAFRENMPTASIIYDVTKFDEDLRKEMNESCRKRIKKAFGEGMEYHIIAKEQYEEFFAKRQKTAETKGFNTISIKQYESLLDYIAKGKGMLIGAFLKGAMIAGTICLFENHHAIFCPYGFFDREYAKIGVQHFLKFKLFQRARDHGYRSVDTGGGAPTGYPKHPLAGVSAFKESLGGTKTDLYGSYDIVLNPILYQIFKLRYKLRA